MTQAIFSSLSGISAGQNQLSVISDNIANMNTPGHKETQITFENLYSRTLSSGSAPTTSNGGTNGVQYGLGVQVGSVTKNFTDGTVSSTNNDSDMNIQGNGFFTVQNSAGEVLLTEVGNFSLDAEGNLVTSDGYKVLGTDSITKATSSKDTVRMPSDLSISIEPNDSLASKDLEDLNNASITEGTFTINVTNGTGTTPVSVDTTGCDTLTEIVTAVNTALTAAGYTSAEVTSSINSTTGKFEVQYAQGGAHTITGLSFAAGGSNFPSETQLSTSSPSTSTVGATTYKTYSSDVLDFKVIIGPADNAGKTCKLDTDFSTSTSGAITASYANAGSISVVESKANPGQLELVFTTDDGVTINASDIKVNADAIKAANLQIQVANVVNTKGLISNGSNNYSIGPNSGEVTYSVGEANGMGKIATGGLEASNVDLTTQFANMILAQRAVEANSRVFDTVNTVMQTLNTMGR